MSTNGSTLAVLLATLLVSVSAHADQVFHAAGLVVVAPHPDDEVLIASGLILKAIEQHVPVSVIIVTAGDFDCRIDARRRKAESLAGLAALGVTDKQVFFLGYPDGLLGRLGQDPLRQTSQPNTGQCLASTGSARDFTAPELVSELQALLAVLKPETLVVTHPEDSHPDHAATYAFVRRALNHLDQAPRVLRAFVHTEDCWPTAGLDIQHCLPGRIAPSEPMPALTGELSGYEPDVRVSVPLTCLSPSLTANPKLRAIAAHASQTRGDPASYLLAFARNDEVFFREDLTRDLDGKWTPLPAPRTPTSPDILIHAGEKLSLKQYSSFAWTVKLPRPPKDEKTQLILMSGKQGQYELGFDGTLRRATIARRTPDDRLRVLQDWLLPHDTWRETASVERFELSLTPRGSRGAAELMLQLNDQLVGVAVDLDPLSQGDIVQLASMTSGDVFLSYSVGQKRQGHQTSSGSQLRR